MTEKKWYALYTRPRTEKKVFLELEFSGIETYLPLITRLKQWSDRVKKVEEPLFRSYVFVHISESEYFKALNVPGATRFVVFEKKAVVIPDNQIEAIKRYLTEPDPMENENVLLSVGQLVKVKHGQMEGLIGKLIRYKNKFRLLVMIEAIGQVITLNIPRSQVEVIAESQVQK